MNFPKVIAVIPARYHSTRFPGKPLTLISGKPMLQWVWEAAKKAKSIHRVIIATDDPRIEEVAKRFEAEVKMTRSDHPSGTDRIAEVTQGIESDWILNIQGDEPLIEGTFLERWISDLNPSFGMATVATPLHEISDLQRPDVVKVSFDTHGRALGFQRKVSMEKAHKWTHQHVGLYAYTPTTLQTFVSLPPSPSEKSERLEQLRAIENGIAIQVLTLNFISVGVDTPGDVTRAERALAERARTVSK